MFTLIACPLLYIITARLHAVTLIDSFFAFRFDWSTESTSVRLLTLGRRPQTSRSATPSASDAKELSAAARCITFLAVSRDKLYRAISRCTKYLFSSYMKSKAMCTFYINCKWLIYRYDFIKHRYVNRKCDTVPVSGATFVCKNTNLA